MKKIWLTRAWKDNEEGDFDYLVQELKKQSIDARFDKNEVVPSGRLWEQIGTKIKSGEYDGWGIVVTENSLRSQPCKEEIEYAIQRNLKNPDSFPLLPLLHGDVSIGDLPAALEARLGIQLSDPEWAEEVRAALDGRAPSYETDTPLQNIKARRHTCEEYAPGQVAYEFRPRYGESHDWRIAHAYDESALVGWGVGGANYVPSATPPMFLITGIVRIEEQDYSFIGAKGPLTPSTSAYIVFPDDEQELIYYSDASEPNIWKLIRLG